MRLHKSRSSPDRPANAGELRHACARSMIITASITKSELLSTMLSYPLRTCLIRPVGVEKAEAVKLGEGLETKCFSTPRLHPNPSPVQWFKN